MMRSIVGLVILLLMSGAASAQQQQCPNSLTPKITLANLFTVSTSDNCSWTALTGLGAITVQLPGPGLSFSPGFTTTLIPENQGTITLTQLPDAGGATHQINGQTSIAYPAGQAVVLKIQQDLNWYALPTAPATGGCNIFTSLLPGCVPASGGGTTNFLRADGTFAVPSGTTVGANPTATIGASAVNGTATTFMRSDAAPPLAVVATPGTNLKITYDANGRVTSGATAACADLSNGGTACPAATGTSGHALPYLDGTNTWAGVQTFGEVLGTVSTPTITANAYTAATTDCGTLVRITNSNVAVTVTLPNSLSPGCNIAWEQVDSTAQITFSAASGAALHSAHSYTKTSGQYAIVGTSVDGNSGGTSAVYVLTGDGA